MRNLFRWLVFIQISKHWFLEKTLKGLSDIFSSQKVIFWQDACKKQKIKENKKLREKTKEMCLLKKYMLELI